MESLTTDKKKYEVRAYNSEGLLIKRRWPVGEDGLKRTLKKMHDMGFVTAHDCYTPSLPKDNGLETSAPL